MRKQSIVFCAVAAVFALHSCKKNDGLQAEKNNSVNLSKRTNAAVSDYAEYKISCVQGGKFFDVVGTISANEKYRDGQKLAQWQATADDERDGWQRWYVIYRTTVGGVKYYHIRNSFSGKVLDVPGGTNVSGTQLQQYAEWPLLGDQQLWRITEIGTSGQYNIISKATGLAVSVAGGSTANGAAIIEETPNGNNRQKWVFSLRTASTYRDDVANRFFNRNGTSQGSTSFDQGNSLPLTWSSNNGKVLWITQDAYDGASLQPNSMFNCGQWFSYGNSMFLQPNINDWGSGAPNITRNGNKQIIDKQGSDTFAWPSAAVEIGQHVYVHVGEGSGLAMSNQSLWDLTQSTGSAWTGVRTTPAGMSGQTNIGYAVGMVKRPDNYVYAFGAQATGFGYSSNIHVARFPVGNPQSWSFWNGSGWVSTPVTGNGARVADALGSSSVAFVNNKYVLMTMDQGFNCDATRNIYISTSANPTGPFTTRVKVWTVQEYINGNYARYYTPIIHPEHVNGRNELLLTYSLNYDACGQGSCSGAYLDPYYYRLKCIRVPYSKIGL